MFRIRFEKAGSAVWISHLDLMRVMQRSFRRGGLLLEHTQGYHPHAYVAMALPLPVGMASRCELMEFRLAEGPSDASVLPELLNAVLPTGIRCLEGYEGGRKLRDLTDLKARVEMIYDGGVPEGAEAALAALLNGPTLTAEKKTKHGPVVQNIRPMVRQWALERTDGETVAMELTVACREPALNPMLVVQAVGRHLPAMAPSFARAERLELYGPDGEIFR